MENLSLPHALPTRQEILDLTQKAEQLSLAYDTVGIVTWVWDIGRDRVQWYGDISQLLGLGAGAFTGRFRDYLELVHPEDAERARQTFVDCLKGRRTQTRSEERVILPDGTARWLETHCRGFYGRAGGAVRMTGVLSNVSYRKAQEEALAISEERFFKAYHATPDGISLSRLADGMIIEINAAFSRITGYSAGEALGKTALSLGLWVDAEQRSESLRALAESGRVRNLVGRIVTRSGEKRTVVFNAERILVGDEPYLMSVTRDITEQHTAEKALEKSERLYRSLFDAALDSIAILSPAGVILDANTAACRATGYGREELVGRAIASLINPRDPRASPGALARAFERGSLLVEREVLRKDGTVVPVEGHAWRLPDGNIQLIVRDLTERKRSEALVKELNVTLEKRVAERTVELEAANRELESFTQTISHDLRAPIRAISGFTEALRSSNAGNLDDKGARYLGLIEKNAGRMNVMIVDLLKFARAGRATVSKVPVDMRAMAVAVVEELATGAHARAEVAVGGLPPVNGDPSLLRQVWVNLVSNALKFSSKVALPRIEIGAGPVEGGTEFTIRDNGCGFEREYADKLFGVFQRLHSDKEYEGNGVGLAIVQRIVERHGGRVSGDSSPGAGAMFRFTLPD
jgi:PAS domain S-box-containing protein